MGVVLLNRVRERAILDIVATRERESVLLSQAPIRTGYLPSPPRSEIRESPFGPGWFA